MTDHAASPTKFGQLRGLARVVRRRGAGYFVLLRVYVLLIVMRGVISAVTLKRITARLGAPMQQTTTDGISEGEMRYARRVGRSIGRVAPFTPTNSNCYPQALTAWWLLHRQRIPTTISYGAAFDEQGTALEAHVWLRCGPLIVTGGGPRRRYVPMTWYADFHPRRRIRSAHSSVSRFGDGRR